MVRHVPLLVVMENRFSHESSQVAIKTIVRDVTRESTAALLKKNVQVMIFLFLMFIHLCE